MKKATKRQKFEYLGLIRGTKGTGKSFGANLPRKAKKRQSTPHHLAERGALSPLKIDRELRPPNVNTWGLPKIFGVLGTTMINALLHFY